MAQPDYGSTAPTGDWAALRPPSLDADILLQRGPQLEPEPEIEAEVPVEAGYPVEFELTKALQTGNLSYKDLAEFFASQSGYKLKDARERGVTDAQVIDAHIKTRNISGLQAFLERFSRESVKSGVTLAAMKAGFVAGTPAAAAFPPAPFITSAASGFAAHFLTDEALAALFPQVYEDLGAQTRTAGVAGETLGMTLPWVAAPWMVAKEGSKAPQFLINLAQSARNYPLTFTAGESAASFSSAAAAAAADKMYRARLGPRLTGEILAGGLNPVTRAVKWLPSLATFVKNTRNRFTTEGAERVASDLLATVLAQYGEDTPGLLRALQTDDELITAVNNAIRGPEFGVPFPGTEAFPVSELQPSPL